jgi:hypothetical protein
MDMTSLLMGLAGKDHVGIHPAERVNLWRQAIAIACEKLTESVRLYCGLVASTMFSWFLVLCKFFKAYALNGRAQKILLKLVNLVAF